VCSVTDALAIVGDRYALLVARELRHGQTHFQDIAAGTGAPRDVLTARLRKLEAAGVIERRRYCEHPPRVDRPPAAQRLAAHPPDNAGLVLEFAGEPVDVADLDGAMTGSGGSCWASQRAGPAEGPLARSLGNRPSAR
jgi:hypothetical protein